MKKLTTEQFIIKARLAHGEKYDYSNSLYTSAVSKIEIICPIHGQFMQKASHHTAGHGCKNCADEARGQASRKGFDIFLKEASDKHSGKYSYQYKDNFLITDRVLISCPLHGDFYQVADTHLSGAGCKKCASESNGRKQSISIDDFISRSSETHGSRYLYPNLKVSKCTDKIIVTCRVHGDFEQQARDHYTGNGCQKCGYIAAIRKKKRSYGFHGHSRSKYVSIANSNKNGVSNLYVIKASGNGENFYKVGISMNSVAHRFASHFPYQIDDFIEIPMKAGDAWDCEKVIHRMLKGLSYRPKIIFNGYTECFSGLHNEAIDFINGIRNGINTKPSA